MLIAAMALASSLAGNAAAAINYPDAPQEPVTDTYFETVVTDRFRPLENDTAAATLQWVEAENAVTRAYLDAVPFRDDIRSQFASLMNFRKTSVPSHKSDGRFYFSENDGLRNQAVIMRRDSLNGPAEVFIDPNTLSDDGTVALTGISMSPDGKYTAYTISRSGSDWTEIYVIDTDSRQPLADHIEWAKFTGAEWYGDGFFYSAYARPEAGKEFSNANENHRIYFHRLGTPQSDDVLFFEDPANPLHFHTAWVPEDSHYIFVFGSGQGFGQSVMFKDLDNPDAAWVVMEPSQDVIINPVGVVDETLYFLTSIDAPRYRLMTAPMADPSRGNWKELIPESADGAVLAGVTFAGDKIIANFERDASTHLVVYNLDGTIYDEIKLPTLGTAGVSSSRHYPEVFYNFTSYLYPWVNFTYDVDSRTSTEIDRAVIEGYDPEQFVTTEVFYPSADGTKVHMFLTHRRDIELDGSNPTYLYGYGGFNISLNPAFSASRLLWILNGGIFAEANLRGGAEYGDTWHEAGTKLEKKNVFNDFIAAAEYLIANGYTSPEHLVIEGASNGGLLVGATVNMRPDLFAVAIPRVGVMDMLRYHLFTIGWNWASDYGTSADSPEMAAYLRSYSPMHNISNDGTPYPAILVTTADHDDRVVPAHSFKYAAELQAANTGDAPKLIRIDSKAGHGAGKPVGKIIDEWTDIYTFIFNNLNMRPAAANAQ